MSSFSFLLGIFFIILFNPYQLTFQVVIFMVLVCVCVKVSIFTCSIAGCRQYLDFYSVFTVLLTGSIFAFLCPTTAYILAYTSQFFLSSLFLFLGHFPPFSLPLLMCSPKMSSVDICRRKWGGGVDSNTVYTKSISFDSCVLLLCLVVLYYRNRCECERSPSSGRRSRWRCPGPSLRHATMVSSRPSHRLPAPDVVFPTRNTSWTISRYSTDAFGCIFAA